MALAPSSVWKSPAWAQVACEMRLPQECCGMRECPQCGGSCERRRGREKDQPSCPPLTWLSPRASQEDRGCGKGSCPGWVRTGAGLFGSLHPFPPESSSGQVSSQRLWIGGNQTQVLPGNKPPQYSFGSQQPLRWYEMLSSRLISEKQKATEFGTSESSCCSAGIVCWEAWGEKAGSLFGREGGVGWGGD